MKMKTIVLLMLAVLSISRVTAEEPAPTEQKKPNIIIIFVDDLSRKSCTFLPGGEGKSLMPTLDRLAREGTILDNMHSPSPVCTPSRYAMLTGNFPSRSRSHAFLRDLEKNKQSVVQFNTHIVPGDVTLPQLMKQAGYVTGAVGKNHVIEVDGYKRLPFKTALDAPHMPATLEKNAYLLRQAFLATGFDYAERLYWGNVDADGIEPLAYHNQEWITEGALEFIDQNKDRPFFLYLGTTLPHGPYEPERGWKSDKSITPEGILDEIPAVQAPRDTIGERLKEAGISEWNTGSVLWMDDAVAAVVQKLEQLGIDDNTVILFMSDQGMEAKGGTYMGGTLTAAFVWRKGGFPAGARTPAGLQLMDIAPTVLALAGADVHGRTFDGASFLPILNGSTTQARETMYFELGYSRAVMKGKWKYIALRYPDFAENMSMEERARILEEHNETMKARGRPVQTTDPATPFSHLFLIPGGHDADQSAVKGYPHFFERDQLYDLETDPGEQRNLAQDENFAPTLNEMKALLGQYVRQVPGSFGEFSNMELR